MAGYLSYTLQSVYANLISIPMPKEAINCSWRILSSSQTAFRQLRAWCCRRIADPYVEVTSYPTVHPLTRELRSVQLEYKETLKIRSLNHKQARFTSPLLANAYYMEGFF